MMGMHANANQYSNEHPDILFAISVTAACIAFVLSYASTLIGRSAILPLIAASVCAMACLLSENNEHRGAAYALMPIGVLLCLAAVAAMAV